MDSIKDIVRSSVKVPEFDKHLKKAGGHISRNVVEITIKMKTIVRKPLMIKKRRNKQIDEEKESYLSIANILQMRLQKWKDNAHTFFGETLDWIVVLV